MIFDMKQFLLSLLAVILAAATVFVGVLYIQYDRTGEEAVPDARIAVLGQSLAPVAYEWQAPVLGGLQYKLLQSGTAQGQTLGEVAHDTPLGLVLPLGYLADVLLEQNGSVAYSGDGADFDDTALAPGSYELTVRCMREVEPGRGYGSFVFHAFFTVLEPPSEPEPLPEPVFTAGRLQLQQGEILPLRIQHLPPGLTPVADTELGMANFVQTDTDDNGLTEWFCIVPIGNTREPGDYTITVEAGAYSWAVTASVQLFNFDIQHLTIDNNAPNVSEANSAASIQEYNQKIPPLWESWDDERYWEGPFTQPLEGRISTEFGEIRYTNGNMSNPRPHYGMDFAVPEGTPIHAPNRGRVVFAEYTMRLGNMVVIEHGGGLKSYYFHMVELNARVDDMVERGDVIGYVGSTGYSTGAHLHYELRIGRQAVSPSMLFDESAALYSLGMEKSIATEAEKE